MSSTRDFHAPVSSYDSRAAPASAPLPLTDEQATAIHRHPFVRDCLLAYFDRPCDKEAAAIVRAIADAVNGLTLGECRGTPAAAAGDQVHG